ncbi:nucleoid-associated protein [Phaeocystidibacter luteus]|uniref:Nucleoid-associated protein n=1 Tax=Phaeocystidibacter luteus TaxID=911197 RepID=A0A6N6RFN3_9FLAO|nr:nucleoid-associated protein [Phaeocystidibacter luteus]KAB2809975.1 nucleoid-associated protein [Phaeocystidibacter luteus]
MNISEAYTSSLALITSDKPEKIDQASDLIIQENQDFFTPALLKHFKSADLLRFEFTHNVDLKYNVLYEASKTLFEDGDLRAFSEVVNPHLRDVSSHPNIKPGDILIAKFTDIQYDDMPADAIGIFKFDARQRILSIDSTGNISIRSGIGTQKPDKACLILKDGIEPTVLILDSDQRESEFWTHQFINAKPASAAANFTSEIIASTKEFVTKRMPAEFEMTKVDEVDLMKRSMEYFNETDQFSQAEYESAVLVDPDVIDSFRSHKNDFAAESGVAVPESFSMVNSVAKKHAGNFKGIIKLDKNFHIYVHGDRSLIERGQDADGRSYYKLYFDKEE